MMQNLGNRRSVQKCAQNAGSNVLKQWEKNAPTVKVVRKVVFQNIFLNTQIIDIFYL